MTRLIALLLTLASPALAYDNAEFLAMCEPEVITENRAFLDDSEWQQVEQRAARIVNGTGRLWQVTTPDGAVSYLWGTMHSSDPRISNVPDEVKAIIADARIMITEYAGAETTMEEARDWSTGGSFFGLHPTLIYESLPAPALQAILKRVSVMGIDEVDLIYVSPAALLTMLLPSPCAVRWSAAGYPIQDRRVELLAADRGLPRISAERRDMIDHLAGDQEWQEAFKATLTAFALFQTMPETTGTHMRYYLDAQIGRMMAFDAVYLQKRFPEIDTAAMTRTMDSYVLEHRNQNMVRKIMPELTSGGAVVAVGCFHLPHDTGLIELLRAEGMTVKRIPLPGEAE